MDESYQVKDGAPMFCRVNKDMEAQINDFQQKLGKELGTPVSKQQALTKLIALGIEKASEAGQERKAS